MKSMSLLVSFSLLLQVLVVPMAQAKGEQANASFYLQVLEVTDQLLNEGWQLESAPGKAINKDEFLRSRFKTIYLTPPANADRNLAFRVETAKIVGPTIEMKLVASDRAFKKVYSRRAISLDAKSRDGKLARLKVSQTLTSMQNEIASKLTASLSPLKKHSVWATLQELLIPAAHANSELPPSVRDLPGMMCCVMFISLVPLLAFISLYTPDEVTPTGEVWFMVAEAVTVIVATFVMQKIWDRNYHPKAQH